MPGPVARLAHAATVATFAAVAAASVITTGCSSTSRRPADDYRTVADDPRRNAELARQDNARAVGLMDAGDWPGAEAALKAALAADIMCGPAHNNLGKVYFHQSQGRAVGPSPSYASPGTNPADRPTDGHETGGSLYLAAWEFQYAMKLMPNQPEPANNLGLVFEAVGKLDEAVDSYGRAVALEPDNIQPLGNLARARFRRGERDDELRAILNKLVLRDTRPEWLRWERNTLSSLEADRAE